MKTEKEKMTGFHFDEIRNDLKRQYDPYMIERFLNIIYDEGLEAGKAEIIKQEITLLKKLRKSGFTLEAGKSEIIKQEIILLKKLRKSGFTYGEAYPWVDKRLKELGEVAK